MGLGRNKTMNPLAVETHHCWSRCVRRAFLMGDDHYTGRNFEHRRQQLFELHEYLASIFMIDVSSVNLLGNHMHLQCRSRPDLVIGLSDEEVVWRMKKAWPRFDRERKWHLDPTAKQLEKMLLRAKNEENYMPRLRRSLSDISCFHARLKEPIARRANREESPCKTGHFWDGRYGSRPVETPEEAVVVQVYIDLQQLKAGIVDRLEDSSYSSIQAHLRAEAEKTFRAVHGRHARDTDEDQQKLEHLQTLHANCWLAPIENDAPLTTELDRNPPPTELVLPAGYYFEQSNGAGELNEVASKSETVGREVATGRGEAAKREGEAPAEPRGGNRPNTTIGADINTNQSSTTTQTTRGRPKLPKNFSINNRLKKLQRRRASRCNVLGLSWDEYFPLVKRIAEQLVKDRQEHFPNPDLGEPPEYPQGSESPSITPNTFNSGLNFFRDWLTAKANDALGELIRLAGLRPREP